MSLIVPNRKRGDKKGGARRGENNRIYANPLPLVFSQTESYTSYILDLFGIPNILVNNPSCEGVFDPITRSVWITSSKDSMILWRRGFFGKGDLSRSEPSWYARQVNARKAAGKYMTSEEIREKRRAERKQFKLDRAAAIAQAAAEAEAAFAEGREAAPAVIPSGATWKPQISAVEELPNPSVSLQDDYVEVPEDKLEDIEHLQLTLQEAFFLIWNLDCLSVVDPATVAIIFSHIAFALKCLQSEPMNLQSIWRAFQATYCSPHVPSIVSNACEGRFDNPFLVNYAAYHYYRSLGWVVKGGIKFCVDFLLYKRGPVFHHAECVRGGRSYPLIEDPADQESSPFDLSNSSPFSWSWLSTVNRVNSQVQKTLILTYVTIPAQSRMSPDLIASPACLAHYSVREVVLRRFIPARMRD
ncbi:putative tRNA-splicing endonuclease subunit sen2 [Grifola frondosa]|uniref:tRNA-splicing endonuclease subunit Sen2 n=1 Tax=Grifola frondosa TaxID=5627 RepID=A0A1C7M990_GRIFR|nr:putative tRNA-splicing endonuclease subunit sen2 [Grifola frondosa]